MDTRILLKIETEHKVASIKTIRQVAYVGLYEAKVAQESGMIFSDLSNMVAFQRAFLANWPASQPFPRFYVDKVPQMPQDFSSVQF